MPSVRTAPTGEASLTTQQPSLDAATVDAFRAGQPHALGLVYDRYAGAVWSVVIRVLGDRALTEDAVQETFLRAWRGAASVEPGRDLAPWLFTIARRTAVDVWRRESRPTQGGHAPEADEVEAAGVPGIEGAWEAWEVRRAVDSLPPDERDIVRMAHYRSMTQGEIAEALGVPLGTVKSRSHRAHRRLAELLGHMLDEGEEVAR